MTLLPAAIEVGDAVLVTTRSAWLDVATTSDAVAVLFPEFGSLTAEVTLAVWLIAVPAATLEPTVTTNEILAGELGARLGSVQVSVASVQVHPVGPDNEKAVVFAGKVSVTDTLVAALGPALLTV